MKCVKYAVIPLASQLTFVTGNSPYAISEFVGCTAGIDW